MIKDLKIWDPKWWSKQKDLVSKGRSARKSSRNIMGRNPKREMDPNYKGG